MWVVGDTKVTFKNSLKSFSIVGAPPYRLCWMSPELVSVLWQEKFDSPHPHPEVLHLDRPDCPRYLFLEVSKFYMDVTWLAFLWIDLFTSKGVSNVLVGKALNWTLPSYIVPVSSEAFFQDLFAQGRPLRARGWEQCRLHWLYLEFCSLETWGWRINLGILSQCLK